MVRGRVGPNKLNKARAVWKDEYGDGVLINRYIETR